ncbi:hypothetical protein ACOME3_008594 [Neoechinorhynchus agilis]
MPTVSEGNLHVRTVDIGCTKALLSQCRAKPSHEFRNQYQLLELLGRGPFSTVRRCVNVTSGTSYAVKIVQVGQLKRNPIHSELLQGKSI